jgi:hypothetical protein
MELSHCARGLTLALLFAACNAVAPGTTECLSSAIVDGRPATLYPEAAVLSMTKHGFGTSECTGAVIAPRVVLTAGHCVASFTSWDVRAPFANQSATSSSAETFDWTDGGTEHVTRDQHDVGLVYLDTPINLTAFPIIANAALADGSKIVNVGRIDDGTVSASAYLSNPVAVGQAEWIGFPFDYFTTRVLELGDSGGPVEVPGATPHTIFAVNSGVTGNADLLARVDLVKDWIQDRVAGHGGNGPSQPLATTPTSPMDGCPAL